MVQPWLPVEALPWISLRAIHPAKSVRGVDCSRCKNYRICAELSLNALFLPVDPISPVPPDAARGGLFPHAAWLA